MTTDFTVTVSRRTSSFGIVRAVEKALMDDLAGPRMYRHESGCETIFVVQALPYDTGITGDPWSPHYPKPAEVIAKIAEHTGIRVEVLP